RHRGLVDPAAQGPVVQLRKQRLGGGVRKADEPATLLAALTRCLGGRADLLAREARQLLALLDPDATVARGLQHVLSKAGAQRREALVELAQLRLLRLGQPCAGPHEADVVALEQLALLARQRQPGGAALQP